MRSTRASTAVERLNKRCPDRHYSMVQTGAGLFSLSEHTESGLQRLCEPLALDDFVQLVNGLGPQEVRRVTKDDAAFARQLKRKPGE